MMYLSMPIEKAETGNKIELNSAESELFFDDFSEYEFEKFSDIFLFTILALCWFCIDLISDFFAKIKAKLSRSKK